MDKALENLFRNLTQEFIGYLPDLLAGIFLLFIGCFLGWLAKRLAIQVMLFLRLERLLVKFQWGEDFSKADIRYGFYNFAGNIIFLILFLIFFNAALSTWKLTLLSDFLSEAIFFLPRVVIAIIVFAFGWFAASWAERALRTVLRREEIPRSTLIAQFGKIMLLILFSAMAVAELGIAREIVIIGFATIFVTLAAIAITMIVLGGKDYFKKANGSAREEENGGGSDLPPKI